MKGILTTLSEFAPLLTGTGLTIVLSFVAFAIGAVLGAFLYAAANQSRRSLRWLAMGYLDFFRTIPEIVPILWLYICAPFFLKVSLTPIAAGIIAFSLIASASFAEIYRTGLESVSNGQREAGRSLGLSRMAILIRIVAPQAIRVIIPPTINLFSDIVKVSSLLSLIGVTELAFATAIKSSETYEYVRYYTYAGAIYLLIIFSASLIARRLSARMRRYAMDDLASHGGR
jgi:His/Glu/Gln/Arg/opine family amino acid ABC transporter permease subunit